MLGFWKVAGDTVRMLVLVCVEIKFKEHWYGMEWLGWNCDGQICFIYLGILGIKLL